MDPGNIKINENVNSEENIRRVNLQQYNVLQLTEFLKKIRVIAGIAGNINQIDFRNGSTGIFTNEAELLMLKKNVQENYSKLENLDGMVRLLIKAISEDKEVLLGQGQTFQSYFITILSQWGKVKNMVSIWVEELHTQEKVILELEKKEELNFKQIFEMGANLSKTIKPKYDDWMRDYLGESKNEIILHNRMYFFKNLVQILTEMKTSLSVTKFGKEFSPEGLIKNYDSPTPLPEERIATLGRSLKEYIVANYSNSRSGGSKSPSGQAGGAVTTAGSQGQASPQSRSSTDIPINPQSSAQIHTQVNSSFQSMSGGVSGYGSQNIKYSDAGGNSYQVNNGGYGNTGSYGNNISSNSSGSHFNTIDEMLVAVNTGYSVRRNSLIKLSKFTKDEELKLNHRFNYLTNDMKTHPDSYLPFAKGKILKYISDYLREG